MPACRTIAVLVLLSCLTVAAAQEDTAKVAAQKKDAESNWAQLEIGDFAHAETTHLLIYAPKSFAGRLKEIGSQLEKAHVAATKSLQFKANEPLWPGKLTVYLFADRDPFVSLVRRVVKRRVEPDELGVYRVDDDPPLIGATALKATADAKIEVQAAQQIGEALLARKAGKNVEVPEWLVTGFGRATAVRAGLRPPDTPIAAKLVAAGRSAADVWGGNLAADEAGILRGSLVDYLAYGGGASKFPAFVTAFQPGQNVITVTTDQALKAAVIDAERVERGWRDALRRK